ncbi:MAG TPA: PP2C family protein-serine/threonine phosphatase [Stellaceae bacterium]|nr:PP2C family protein-serine/threonine phosphatase [Stellaceae bacterium]
MSGADPAARAAAAEAALAAAAAEAALVERTFQLELVLEVLRNRDRAAAEQAEWDFAAELQRAGLPQEFPPFPDRNDFDLHAGMVTAKEVGGDLYDFFLLDSDRLGFTVADAAGKGLPAAIFITLMRTLLKAAAFRLDDPGQCLRTVNAMLSLNNPSLMFATAFYGVLDLATGSLRYANAGHNAPYILRARGGLEAAPRVGDMALGVVEDSAYRTRSLSLAPGDALVCYSDGVTDAIDPAGTLFGEVRLEDCLARQTSRHPTDLLGAVIAEVDQYMSLAPMADDVTLLVLRYNGR